MFSLISSMHMLKVLKNNGTSHTQAIIKIIVPQGAIKEQCTTAISRDFMGKQM